MAWLRFVGASLLACLSQNASASPLDKWANSIAEASARFGIPQDWIRRVIRVESGGETMVRGEPITSPVGAMGLMQLMPATWAEMRNRHHLGNDPYDPHDNILAGSAYLRAMYDRFGFPDLFGAYNAGPTRFSEYLEGKARIPVETAEYIAKLNVRRRQSSRRRLKFARGIGPALPIILIRKSSGAGPSVDIEAAGAGLFGVRNGREQ